MDHLKIGDEVVALTTVNMRATPAGEIIARLLPSYRTQIIGGPTQEGDLTWWQVTVDGVAGWVAEAVNGSNLIDKVSTNDRAAVIGALAQEYNIDIRLVAAVVAIESGGSGYRGGRLIIRFEPHVFRNEMLATSARLFTMGEPSWDGNKHFHRGREFHGDQDAEYAALADAVAAMTEAAYRSVSYGAGQIMGFNHTVAGYDSAQAMAAAFQESEEHQLRAMFRFMDNQRSSEKVNPSRKTALEHLREGNYLMFASIYNGLGQAQHYAGLIKNRAGL